MLRQSDNDGLRPVMKQHILSLSCLNTLPNRELHRLISDSKPQLKLPSIDSTLTLTQILNSSIYRQLQVQFGILQSRHNYSLLKLREFQKTKSGEFKAASKKTSRLRGEVQRIRDRIKQLQETIQEEQDLFENVEIEYQESNQEGIEEWKKEEDSHSGSERYEIEGFECTSGSPSSSSLLSL